MRLWPDATGERTVLPQIP